MKKFNPAFFLLLLSSFFFLAGCYGLQNPSECDNMEQPVDKMRCYHRAAINAAYANDKDNVAILCNKISNLGAAYRRLNLRDIEKQAEIEKNRCYYDAAIIMGRAEPDKAGSLCNEITEENNVFGLNGAIATQKSCKEEVNRLRAINQDNYYRNPSNICALVAILLVPLAAILFNRALHKL